MSLAELPVLHPAETVRIDVERLTGALSVSPRIKISGYSYDLETGLLTTVVPPQSRGDA
jgi:carbonic anhydrase